MPEDIGVRIGAFHLLRRPSKSLLTVLLFVACSSAQTSEGLDRLSAAQWDTDISLLVQQMPKVHKNLFHCMQEAPFRATASSLLAKLPELNTDEVVVEL